MSIGVASQAQAMVPEVVRIADVKQEIAGVFTLQIALPRPMLFTPGQFTMLYMFGVGEVPISISGNPSETTTLVHTIRAVGGVTRAMARLQPGDAVGLRGPYGTPWPLSMCEGNDVLLVAGGLGLAPLRPVIYELLRQRQKYGRIDVLYGSRSPDDILFYPQLIQWQREHDINIVVTVDHGNDTWRGHIGVVPKLLTTLDIKPKTTQVLSCGPEIMMRYTIRELSRLGVKHENMFVSLERNMHCAIGLCGHCQYGPKFICKDGPVFRFDKICKLFDVREI